jgi:Phosphoribosyl transferase (PRTase)/PELOTA RNA binding domain
LNSVELTQNKSVQSQTVSHSYLETDLKLHLDLGEVELVDVLEKERRLQQGESYGRLLTPEALPNAEQSHWFATLLEQHGSRIAAQVVSLGLQLRAAHGSHLTLVSLARAGIPVGVLLTRYLRTLGCDVGHHGISIIRGHGLDMIALEEIVRERGTKSVVFVDGWTGKGSIRNELNQSLTGQKCFGQTVAPTLAVLCDPAGIADFQATFEDQMLPHACLNATVGGLISRTFLHDLELQARARHAARFETDLVSADSSLEYVDRIEHLMLEGNLAGISPGVRPINAAAQALELGRVYGVHNPHHVKPSLGEAWRTLLRRTPRALLLGPEHAEQTAIVAYAQHKQVPLIRLDQTMPYQVIALLGEEGTTA